MKKINVLVCSVICGLGLTSVAAMAADTSLNASANWQVNAVKDSKHGLIVEPNGSVNLSFNPIDKKWTTGSAPFKISVMGQTGDTMKLEAQLASPVALVNGLDGKSKLNLGAYAGQVPLTVSKYADIMAANALGLAGVLNGNTGVMEQSASKLTISAVGGVGTDGSSVAADAVPDGKYSGDLQVDFQATWSYADKLSAF